MKNSHDLCLETEELLNTATTLLSDLNITRAKHYRNIELLLELKEYHKSATDISLLLLNDLRILKARRKLYQK